MPQDKISVLYNAVSEDYDIGSEADFRQKLQDPTKRKAFFDGVGSEYQLGNYDEFENKIGVSKQPQQVIPTAKTTGVPSIRPTTTLGSFGATSPLQVELDKPLPQAENLNEKGIKAITQAAKGITPTQTDRIATPAVPKVPELEHLNFDTKINDFGQKLTKVSEDIQQGNADIEYLTEQYNSTEDPNQKNELAGQINGLIENQKNLYRVGGVLQAGIRNVDALKEINKEKGFTFGTKADAAVQSTTNNIVNGLGKMVNAFGDLNYQFNQAIGAGALNEPDYDNKVTDQLSESIDDVYENLQGSLDKTLPKSYAEYNPITDKADAGKLLYFGMNATAQLAPTIAAGLATGGLGLAASGFTMEFGGMYDSFYDPLYNKYKEEGKSEDEAKKLAERDAALMATTGSLVVGQLEKFGAGELIDVVTKKSLLRKITKDALANLGEKGAAETSELAIKKSLKENIADFAKGYGKTVGKEVLGETTQELVAPAEQDAYDAITSGETFDKGLANKETWANAASAGVGALFATGLIGIGGGVSNMTRGNYDLAMKLEGEDKLAGFQEMLQKEVQNGFATPEMAQNAYDNVVKIQAADKKVPKNINRRDVAVGLIIERDNLIQEIEGMDDALVGLQKKAIADINEDLNRLANNKPLLNEEKESQDEAKKTEDEQPAEQPTTAEDTGVLDSNEPSVTSAEEAIAPPTSEQDVTDSGAPQADVPAVSIETKTEVGLQPEGETKLNVEVPKEEEPKNEEGRVKNNFINGVNLVLKQGGDIAEAIAATNNYLTQQVDEGNITQDQANKIANEVSDSYNNADKNAPSGTTREMIDEARAAEKTDFNKSFQTTKLTELKAQIKNFTAGLKQGVKEGKVATKESLANQKEQIKRFQQSFKDFVGENLPDFDNLSPRTTKALFNHISSINSKKTLEKAIKYYEKVANDVAIQDKIDEFKSLVKKAKNISSKRAIASNTEFVNELSGLNPNKLLPLELEQINQLLNQFNAQTRGKTLLVNIKNEIDKIKADVDQREYENNIAEKERESEEVEDAYLEAMDRGYIPEGLSLEEFTNMYAPNEDTPVTPYDETSPAAKSAYEKLLEDVKGNWEYAKENLELKEQFDNGGAEMAEIYELIDKGNWSVLNTAQLIQLNSIINNVVSDGDFTGAGFIPTTKLKIAENMKPIKGDWFRDIEGSVLGIFKSAADKLSVEGMKKAILRSQKNMPAFTKALLNSSEGRLNKLRKDLVVDMNMLFEKGIERHNITPEQTTRIDTFAFINQWKKGATQDEINEAVKARAAHRANQLFKTYYANRPIKGQVRTEQSENLYTVAERGLKFLSDIGAIKGLDLSKEQFADAVQMNPDFVISTDQLAPNELAFYDRLTTRFKTLAANVKNNIRVYANKIPDDIENYFPTFTSVNFEENTNNAGINMTFNGGGYISSASGGTNQRTGLSDKRDYQLGLRANFSKGLWENLILDQMPFDRNYLFLSAQKGSPIYALIEKEAGAPNARFLENKMRTYIQDHLTFGQKGTLNMEERSLTKKISDVVTSNLIRRPSQLFNQTGGAIIYNIVNAPKVYFDTYQIMIERFKNPMIKQGEDMLLLNSKTSNRVLLGDKAFSNELKPLEEVFLEPSAYKRNVKWEKVLDFYKTKLDFGATEAGDKFTSATSFKTGYLKYMYENNLLKDVEGFKQHLINIANGQEVPNESAIAAGDSYQEEVNANSTSDERAEVLRNADSKLTAWYLRSFSLSTHTSMMQSVRTAFDETQSKDVRMDATRQAVAYMAQIAAFRTTQYMVANYVWGGLNAATRVMLGVPAEDDEERRKRLQRNKVAKTILAVSDLFGGSKSAMAGSLIELGFNIGANAAIIYYADEKKIPTEDRKNTIFDSENLYRMGENSNTPTSIAANWLIQGGRDIIKTEKFKNQYGEEGIEIGMALRSAQLLSNFAGGAISETTGKLYFTPEQRVQHRIMNLASEKGISSLNAKRAVNEWVEDGKMLPESETKNWILPPIVPPSKDDMAKEDVGTIDIIEDGKLVKKKTSDVPELLQKDYMILSIPQGRRFNAILNDMTLKMLEAENLIKREKLGATKDERVIEKRDEADMNRYGYLVNKELDAAVKKIATLQLLEEINKGNLGKKEYIKGLSK